MSATDEAQMEDELLRDIRAATETALKADREAALRDVFAASVVGSLIVKGFNKENAARLAYEHADAMLAARSAS